MDPEGTDANNQEKNTTKPLSTRKSHTNKLHAKLSHPGEDRICATAKNLHCRVKEKLEVCEDFPTGKIKKKLLCKVAEERDLKS